MSGSAPSFWWEQPGWQAAFLSPFSALYGAVAAHRMRNAARVKVDAPVICVGNFTVGGSGKTPTTIALAKAALAMGLKPGIVSRGHGGKSKDARIVNALADTAESVGDEPLLLSEAAPVAVTADRVAGAKLLIERGCDLIVMDDGFQSARIHFDHALIVADGRNGLGNGRVIPAGPMRAGIDEQMEHASALLIVGQGAGALELEKRFRAKGLPVFHSRLAPKQDFTGKRLLAFAGIGHPRKFFDTVAEAGGIVVATRPFGDHSPYSDNDLRELADSAGMAGLELVTTAKDAVRIGRTRLDAMLPGHVHVLDVEAVFDPADVPARIITAAQEAYSKR